MSGKSTKHVALQNTDYVENSQETTEKDTRMSDYKQSSETPSGFNPGSDKHATTESGNIMSPPFTIPPECASTQVLLNIGVLEDFGHDQAIKGRAKLLRNIRGFLVELREIATIESMLDIYETNFSETLKRYGLSMEHILGYEIGIWTVQKYPYTIGPVGIQHPLWNEIMQEVCKLVLATCEKHMREQCTDCCIHEPVVVIFHDYSAFLKGLESRGLKPETQIDFIDNGPALQKRIDSVPDSSRTIYTELQAAAQEALTTNSISQFYNPQMPQASTLAAPSSIPAGTRRFPFFINGRHAGSMDIMEDYLSSITLSPGSSMNVEVRLAGSPLEASAIVQSSTAVPLTPVRNASGEVVFEMLGRNLTLGQKSFLTTNSAANDLLARARQQSLARALNTSNADRILPAERSRPSNSTDTPRKTLQPVVPRHSAPPPPDSPRWNKATPQPLNSDTKALTDHCLTCIQYSRHCKGTQLDDKGRCANCSKGDKCGGRKCYWADPTKGIRTYKDAQDADPDARPLPSNTREGRKARQAKNITKGVAKDATDGVMRDEQEIVQGADVANNHDDDAEVEEKAIKDKHEEPGNDMGEYQDRVMAQEREETAAQEAKTK